MSAPVAASPATAARGTAGDGPTLGRAVRAEWLKFRTLRSHPATALAALAVIVLLAVVLVVVREDERSATSMQELLTGVSWAQMLLALLAVVGVCSEWSSGTSRVTFLSVPARWPVLLGKAAVAGSVSFAVGVVGAAASLAVGAAGGIGEDAGLAIRLMLGSGAYLGGLSLLALGIGAVVRNLVGGILAAIGFLWVTPFAAALVPLTEVQRLVAYLPVPAGGRLIAAEGGEAALTPLAGGAVLLAWAAASLIGAAIALRARDV